MKSPADYFKPPIQSHRGFRSSSSSANPECLYQARWHAGVVLSPPPSARDARVAGKVEGDHGNLGMYRLRSQQNGFRLLNTLDPPKRIGETDPPALVFRLNLYKVAKELPPDIQVITIHPPEKVMFVPRAIIENCERVQSKGWVYCISRKTVAGAVGIGVAANV